MWFLYFILLTWCITLIDLCMLNHPCIPGINATWWCCMIFFNILSNVVCYYCLKNICTYIYLEYWPIIFFLEVFIWLWYYSNTGLIKWVWESSLLCNFLEEFENRHKFFKSSLEFTGKPSDPGLLLVGIYLITDSVSLLIIYLFQYSKFLHHSALVGFIYLQYISSF